MDIELLLELSLSQTQLYIFAFILGSFTVASLSDLRRMSAQVEFLEIWFLIVLVILLYDIFLITTGVNWVIIAVKWIIILIFSVISHHSIGIYFKLATGDAVACAAVAALLSPPLIILFFIVLKLISPFMKPFLRMYGNRNAYPFMPVVLVGTLLTVAIIRWVIPWIAELF